MEDLFRSYWWLLFPLSWFVFGGINSVVNYYRQKNVLNLLRTYAEKGQEPPAALLSALEQPVDEWGETRKPRRPTNYWAQVGLFAVMAAGFGGAALFGQGNGYAFPFTIVAFVMAAVAVWALINAMTQRRGSGGRDTRD